jgi:hypothetical protein
MVEGVARALCWILLYTLGPRLQASGFRPKASGSWLEAFRLWSSAIGLEPNT